MTGVGIVGRERELSVLVDCLDAARRGHPRVVSCRGEPGIGKTRLAEELGRSAAASGVLVAWGLGMEMAGTPPYWPWRQVLRALSVQTHLVAIADEHRLTVDLARLAPDIFAEADPGADMTRSPDDRFRQFDAVARLLGFVTSGRPVLIVIDDAHWADRPSLLLLQHLARVLTIERLLVVVNHRDTEPLTGVLGEELLRAPVTRQFALRGLTSADVGRQLAAVIGHGVDDADIELVFGMTGGNPLFVGELGRVLADRRQGTELSLVTSGVREAIGARLRRLSEPAGALLRAASVVGQEFSVNVVAAVVGRPALMCLPPLDEAVAAGLVEPASTPGEHRFAHALVREAIEAGVGSAERVRLHRLAAGAVEEFYAGRLEAHLSDLARHWAVAAVAAVAGDLATAAHWSELAGQEAMRRLAYEEGVRLFRLACTVGAGELDEVHRCRLLLATGEALHLAADIPGRLQACMEAAGIARRIGRPDLLAQAALILECVLESQSDRAAHQLSMEAMTALGAAPSALSARVTARFAEASCFLGENDAAAAAGRRALEMAEQCGDPTALKAALSARQLVCSGPDGFRERGQLAGRMLAIGRQTGDAQAQMSGHLWLIDAAFGQGNLLGVARETEQLALCVERVGGRLAQWQLLRVQAALAQAQGRFADAHRLSDEAHNVISATGHPFDYTTRVSLLGMTGRHVGHGSEGSDSLRVGKLVGSAPGPRGTHTPSVIDAIGLGAMLVDEGRVAEAADRYRALGPVTEWVPSPVVELVIYAFAVHVAVAMNAADDLAALRELLTPYRGLHVSGRGGAVYYSGPVELYLGVCAANLDLLDDAIADLGTAAEVCARIGAAGFHAEALCELATVLARRGTPADLTRAHQLATAAAAEAATLGMTPWVDRLDQLTQTLDGPPPDVLTPREREVAELVTQGLTNRDIASRLYLSERTAQNHVQHILTKLDMRSRGQIAVWITSQR